MKKVEKKVWPRYFKQIESGNKKFELRLNDFEISEGDILILREWDPKTKEYTGREIEKDVGYVLKIDINDNSIWPKEEIIEKGFLVISLE